MEQSQLISLIVGVEPRLPKTRAVVGETQAGAVKTAADQALAELRTVLRELGAEEGAVMP